MKKLWIATFLVSVTGCVYHDMENKVSFDCSPVTITVTLDNLTNVSSCNATDGSISISASGGTGPYTFSINGGDFNSNSLFENLGIGSYTLLAKDVNGCIGTLLPSPSLTSPGSNLIATAIMGIDTGCLTDNGSISVSASGGVSPYSYKLGNGTFGSSPDFANLPSGSYTVTIQDSEGCKFSLNTVVGRGDTGIRWSSEVQNIISSNCAVPGCHNGTRPPNLSTLTGVQTNKESIKTRTANKSMPPGGGNSLSEEEIKKIGCWVDDGALDN